MFGFIAGLSLATYMTGHCEDEHRRTWVADQMDQHLRDHYEVELTPRGESVITAVYLAVAIPMFTIIIAVMAVVGLIAPPVSIAAAACGLVAGLAGSHLVGYSVTRWVTNRMGQAYLSDERDNA